LWSSRYRTWKHYQWLSPLPPLKPPPLSPFSCPCSPVTPDDGSPRSWSAPLGTSIPENPSLAVGGSFPPPRLHTCPSSPFVGKQTLYNSGFWVHRNHLMRSLNLLSRAPPPPMMVKGHAGDSSSSPPLLRACPFCYPQLNVYRPQPHCASRAPVFIFSPCVPILVCSWHQVLVKFNSRSTSRARCTKRVSRSSLIPFPPFLYFCFSRSYCPFPRQ